MPVIAIGLETSSGLTTNGCHTRLLLTRFSKVCPLRDLTRRLLALASETVTVQFGHPLDNRPAGPYTWGAMAPRPSPPPATTSTRGRDVVAHRVVEALLDMDRTGALAERAMLEGWASSLSGGDDDDDDD